LNLIIVYTVVRCLLPAGYTAKNQNGGLLDTEIDIQRAEYE
jgi:hypothetical protein